MSTNRNSRFLSMLLGAELLFAVDASAQLYQTDPVLGAPATEGSGYVFDAVSVNDAERSIQFRVRPGVGATFAESGALEIREASVSGPVVTSMAHAAGVASLSLTVNLDFTSGSKTYYAVKSLADVDGINDDEWAGGIRVSYGPDASVPVVRNVRASQDEGKRTVTVRYDLIDGDSETLEVTLEASADGGVTWDVPVVTVEGHVGDAVRPGANRSIVWNAGVDWPNQNTDQMRFRVLATEYFLPLPGAFAATIAAGWAHSLFLGNDGTLWAMGYNYYGQLGDGTMTDRRRPVQVAQSVAKVAAGYYHSLFVKTDGTLWAMGYNRDGQLGDGTTESRYSPVQVDSGVAQATAGEAHSLYVKMDGTLWAMGYNHRGQLGDDTTTDRYSPVQIDSGVRVASAGEDHSLYIKQDRTLWATGSNSLGQFGDGTSNGSLSPVQVASEVVQLAAAGGHSLFVKEGGTLCAMGLNGYGQLGDGTTERRYSPVEVASGVAPVSLDAKYHSLYLKTDETLWAMGWNRHGQLGDGTTTDRHSPVQIAQSVAKVAAGYHHSLYVKTDGTLWAMGLNDWGQLGDGTRTFRPRAVQVASGVALPN
ncbi:RCC1 domain-containing protein [Haloferula sp. A504]|uniref:RCC1 domain-containing protein n=1 Tax=Haloferula sp. A504 TaxID=3373601 RepID=UPI0031C2C7A8|nr:hypothetical protein [Verrucomicrobiaceae bacterium E54]